MALINQRIIDVLELTARMLELGDQGMEEQIDNQCGILFNILRDYAFSLKQLAENELDHHRCNGMFDLEDEKNYRNYHQFFADM